MEIFLGKKPVVILWIFSVEYGDAPFFQHCNSIGSLLLYVPSKYLRVKNWFFFSSHSQLNSKVSKWIQGCHQSLFSFKMINESAKATFGGRGKGPSHLNLYELGHTVYNVSWVTRIPMSVRNINEVAKEIQMVRWNDSLMCLHIVKVKAWKTKMIFSTLKGNRFCKYIDVLSPRARKYQELDQEHNFHCERNLQKNSRIYRTTINSWKDKQTLKRKKASYFLKWHSSLHRREPSSKIK